MVPSALSEMWKYPRHRVMFVHHDFYARANISRGEKTDRVTQIVSHYSIFFRGFTHKNKSYSNHECIQFLKNNDEP